jgi:hypothetical protein
METAIAPVPKRNNPWDRNPAYRHGKPRQLSAQPRDREILALLTRYRYLPGDYIHAFVGGSYQVVQRRLGRMTRAPYQYVKRPDFLHSKMDRNYRRRIYELDRAGEVLIGAEKPNCHENEDHELMACCALASVELSARDAAGMRFIPWDEIFANDRMPTATRDMHEAAALRVVAPRLGDTNERKVVPDTLPFGIERTIDGRKSYLFFAGIEADRNKDPVFTSNLKRASLYRKVIEYLAVEEDQRYRTQWGVPNCYVPILTSTPEHAKSILKLIHHLTGGQGSKHLLVGVFPGFFYADDKPPTAYVNMMAFHFERVGYPSFNILKS